jgi:ketosteroid isomerase-like protein
LRWCAGSTSSLRPEESRGFLELATDDIVWISDPRFPGGGRHNGRENVRRWLTELWIYDEVSIDVEEIIDFDDRALGITWFHGVSADAPPVDWPWCHLFAFRDGLISQAQSFLDRVEALEAAGRPHLRASRSRPRI